MTPSPAVQRRWGPILKEFDQNYAIYWRLDADSVEWPRLLVMPQPRIAGFDPFGKVLLERLADAEWKDVSMQTEEARLLPGAGPFLDLLAWCGLARACRVAVDLGNEGEFQASWTPDCWSLLRRRTGSIHGAARIGSELLLVDVPRDASDDELRATFGARRLVNALAAMAARSYSDLAAAALEAVVDLARQGQP